MPKPGCCRDAAEIKTLTPSTWESDSAPPFARWGSRSLYFPNCRIYGAPAMQPASHRRKCTSLRVSCCFCKDPPPALPALSPCRDTNRQSHLARLFQHFTIVFQKLHRTTQNKLFNGEMAQLWQGGLAGSPASAQHFWVVPQGNLVGRGGGRGEFEAFT